MPHQGGGEHVRTQSLSHFPSSRTRLQKQCELVTGLAFNDQHRQSLSQYFVKKAHMYGLVCVGDFYFWCGGGGLLGWKLFYSLFSSILLLFFPSSMVYTVFTPKLQRISRHTSFRSTEPSSFSQICVRVRMCMHACVHVFFLLYIDSILNPHSIIKVPIFNIIIIFNN